MEQAVRVEGKSLAVIRKESTHEQTVIVVSEMIIGLNEYLNIQRTMNETQILDTANLILEHYYYMKLHEIQYVLNQAKAGRFGQLYESIDGLKIMGWFNKYAEERMNHFETESIRTHEQTKETRNYKPKF